MDRQRKGVKEKSKDGGMEGRKEEIGRERLLRRGSGRVNPLPGQFHTPVALSSVANVLNTVYSLA